MTLTYWMLLWGAEEIDGKFSEINLKLPDVREATEPEEATMVGHLLSAFPALLNSTEDGYYFYLRTQDEEIVSAVKRAFSNVASLVASDPWVLEHLAELEWDDEYDGCLKFPDEITD